MLWLARFVSPIIKRPRAALFLTLIAVVACADRDATAPQRTPAQQRASMTINPAPFDDLWISPNVVESGDQASGTITLAAPAPAGGAHIRVKTRHPIIAPIDSDIVVPAGATSKTFVFQTYPTPLDVSVGVDADWGAAHASTYFVAKQVLWWRQYPVIRVVPDVAIFPAQAIGTTSPPQALAVRNIGTAPLILGVISTSGPFTQTNNCTAPLAPNASCTVWVRYVPTGAGSQYGQLIVPGNSQGTPPPVALGGTGFVAVPALSLSSTSMGFGTRPIGMSTPGKSVTITSTGNAPLVVSSLSIGGANPGDFTIISDGCTGVSLNPGASCTASLSFEPLRTGGRSATLTIAHNASGGSSAVSLNGTGSKPGGGGYIP